MRYFKYLDKRGLVLTLKNGMKFSNFQSFNDLEEYTGVLDEDHIESTRELMACKPDLERDADLFVKQGILLRRLGLYINEDENNREIFPELVQGSRVKEYEESLQAYQNLYSHIRKRILAYCLSKNLYSRSMWAYYADQYAGGVIEFCDLELEFRGDETEYFDLVRPVDYVSQKSRIGMDPRHSFFLGFEKNIEWAHEVEYRILLPFDDPRFMHREGVATLSIPGKRISRVYLGARASDSDVEELEELVDLTPELHHVTVHPMEVIENGDGFRFGDLV